MHPVNGAYIFYACIVSRNIHLVDVQVYYLNFCCDSDNDESILPECVEEL